ncbi:AEC family transporter [Streptomyces sp. DSM 44915]|uniref:AEC family transporter n=1 Tax=Streptomyces chisholmiae TaxID=3075540 RepID=A0ABU2JRY8_9ACTN|nr:AEC family transporter [Streptomyces sp. DSM 44915]MDT0267289.1 AEC family transporter [Streptomyces sp. DSM 44915]
MGDVLAGFLTIGVIITVGYLAGRRNVLGETGPPVLTRLAFSVATPALLFTVLADADLATVLSAPLLVIALSSLAVALLFLLAARVRRWGVGYATMGALCASYVNAGNLGIPIAAYVLHDASLVAPVLLLQQLVITPVALTVLDLTTAEQRPGPLRRLTTPFRNPVVIGSLAGLAVNAAGVTVPAPVLDPITLIGGMSVPAVLLAFGISLHGRSVPARGPDRWPVLLAVLLKTGVQPLLAALIGHALGLDGATLFTVTVLAALPSAQNLYTYAARYATATTLTRDAVLLSTLLAVPALLLITLLLG